MTALFDLFCCQGGAAKGYHDAGFDVIGVDIKPQPRYPYDMAVGDAIELLRQLLDGRTHPVLGYGLGDIDAIHASPPCQSFTAYRRKGHGVGDGYLNLIPETRELLDRTGLPYVVENVEQAKGELRDPVRYCGSSFGLDVRRHRLFESNVPLMPAPCDHSWQTPRFPPATNRSNLRRTVEVGVWRIPLETQRVAMGIDWMDLAGLSQAIPPAYSRHVGEQIMRHLDAEHGRHGSSHLCIPDSGAFPDRGRGYRPHMDVLGGNASSESLIRSACVESDECCLESSTGRDAQD